MAEPRLVQRWSVSTGAGNSVRRRQIHRSAAAAVAALGLALPADAGGQSLGMSSPHDIIAGDPSAFVRLVAASRPAPMSPDHRALVLRSLPAEGEAERLGARSLAKLSALRPLLEGTDRESVYAIKVIDVPQAAIGIHGRTVILISARALEFLSVEELRATVAHELGHEYVWAAYDGARRGEDHERLAELELVCDAIAIVTLRGLAMSTAALVGGLEKMTQFNRRQFGVSVREKSYPSIAVRRRFARAVEAWLEQATPAH